MCVNILALELIFIFSWKEEFIRETILIDLVGCGGYSRSSLGTFGVRYLLDYHGIKIEGKIRNLYGEVSDLNESRDISKSFYE